MVQTYLCSLNSVVDRETPLYYIYVYILYICEQMNSDLSHISGFNLIFTCYVQIWQ